VPYSLSWYHDRRIQQVKLYGHFTLEEIRSLNAEASAMTANGIPLIHVIVDVADVEKYPTSLAAIKEMMTAQRQPDKLGWILIFGTKNPMMRFLVNVITQFSADTMRFRLMNSMDEIIECLYEVDGTLSETLPEEHEQEI
jgi:hypothetical protein